MTFGQILMGVRQLALAGPVSVDGLVGVDQPIRNGEAEEGPHEGLADGCSVVSIVPITPGVDEVATARDHRTVILAGMALSAKGGSTHIEVGDEGLELLRIQTRLRRRDPGPVPLGKGNPVGELDRHLDYLQGYNARFVSS